MTDPDGSSANFAGEGSHSFVQARNVYGGVVYGTVVHGDLQLELPPGATAEDKYRVGVENLKSRKATRARELIWEAMTEDYQTSRARFHWLVAMLSGRTIRQFSDEELDQLKSAWQRQPDSRGDPWNDGARVIFRLLEATSVLRRDPRPEIADVVKEFDTLGTEQCAMLLPHTELFLKGKFKDELRERELAAAQEGRRAGRRRGRAWMFFQPIPARPRVRPARPPETAARDRMGSRASVPLLIMVAGYFGWSVVTHAGMLGVLVCLAGVAGAVAVARGGPELRFLAERQQMKEHLLRPLGPSGRRPPRDGFADKVDALFRHYSAVYVPTAEREEWRAATAGLLACDRDEIVEMYRESRIPAERVGWLIRYRIRQSRDRRRDGKGLYDFRNELRPTPRVVASCRVGGAFAVLCGVAAVYMLRSAPFAVAFCVIAGVPVGVWAWRSRLKIYLARRHYEADEQEAERRQADSDAEFTRWTDRLKARPTDAEMAAWLDCDRTVLLGQAIGHYKLARHQVLTHAFLERPGAGARSARVHNGPMRYSRYGLIVFVLTADGVRQLTADLSTVELTIQHRERLSYRYDAVASAHISLPKGASTENPRSQQKFTLTLVNGQPVTVDVTDIGLADLEPGEDEKTISDATLDAASLTNTLHVLEGIAAEGKGWVQAQKTDGMTGAMGRSG